MLSIVRRLARALGLGEPAMAEIDGVLPGSVVVRHMRCGKSGCACRADPPALHGPYIQWTRSEGGKTVTRFLSEEQLARYQPWFDNARRLKDLTAKLQIASVHAFEQTEGSAKPTAKTSKPTPPSAAQPGVHGDNTSTDANPPAKAARPSVSPINDESPGSGQPSLARTSLQESRTQ